MYRKFNGRDRESVHLIVFMIETCLEKCFLFQLYFACVEQYKYTIFLSIATAPSSLQCGVSQDVKC